MDRPTCTEPARRRWGPAVALLAALSLLAGACSETDDGEESTGGDGTATTATTGEAEPGTRTTRGVTDTTVTVGGLLYGAFFGGADVGVQARLERANSEGGVHGRTIEFVGADDTNNEQANALSIAQRLVQQEQVFALLPVASSQLGIVDFVEREVVPFFGYGTDPAFCGTEYAFGVTGCVTDPNFARGSNASGLVLREYFGGDTDRTVALLGEDNDAARGGVRLLSASVRDVGFDVVYEQNAVPPPPSPVGDFSPFVTQIMSADGGGPPDVVYAVLTGATAVGLHGALQGAGYEGLVVIPSYDPRIAGAVEGAASIIQFAPYELAGEIPRLQQMIDDVRAVDPDQLLTVGVAAGYWAADLFVALLEETGEDLTVERLLAASDGWTYEVPEVVGRSEWPLNHDVPVPCAALARSTGDGFEVAVPLTCGEHIDVEG